jgi:ABC-2 type transport system permease protein
MSTAVLPSPASSRGASSRPGLGRLTLVELRKMSDTRAGFWLLFSTALLTVAVAVIAGIALPDADATLVNYLAISLVPASVLLPVVGILLVTSEWTQRTAMVTFALVPHRGRVLLAKLLAGMGLTLVAFQICLVMALIATAVAGGGGAEEWSLSAGLIGQAVVSISIPMLTGIGFGAALLSSAPAIVLYFVLPTAFGILGSLNALEGAARWLDQSRTMEKLVEETLSGTQWARLGASVALWTLLPLVVGWWRVARSDVR